MAASADRPGLMMATSARPEIKPARRRGRPYRWPAAAYMSKVETWRELPGGEIEFTIKRLKSAD
jgi:hypothetical protein